MSRNNNQLNCSYSSPKCETLTLEVRGLLATSPVTTEMDIKDPTWNIGGDYGLE